MPQVPVNHVAVFVSAVIPIIVGMVWHGKLFWKQWATLSGQPINQQKPKDMGKKMLIAFVGWLLMSYVLQHAIVFANAYLGTSGVFGGLMSGFFNWLGFTAIVSAMPMLWEGKSWKLWFINSGHILVSLLIMGAILSVWM